MHPDRSLLRCIPRHPIRLDPKGDWHGDREVDALASHANRFEGCAPYGVERRPVEKRMSPLSNPNPRRGSVLPDNERHADNALNLLRAGEPRVRCVPSNASDIFSVLQNGFVERGGQPVFRSIVFRGEPIGSRIDQSIQVGRHRFGKGIRPIVHRNRHCIRRSHIRSHMVESGRIERYAAPGNERVLGSLKRSPGVSAKDSARGPC